ncbi:hypothetical protein SDC9_158062 [bioreactor metagenome]|uniref:Uncharacterized protein n=1 Tax=bioreactor metagenome TaxID=1076179 RepID=A0A645F8Q5_9ZZZZ
MAPTYPLKTNKSLSLKYFVTFPYNLLKTSSSIGRFTSPQFIKPFILSCLTMNLSLGDLPVYFPVLTTNAPLSARVPSPLLTACSTKQAALKFLKIFLKVLICNPSKLFEFIILTPEFQCLTFTYISCLYLKAFHNYILLLLK